MQAGPSKEQLESLFKTSRKYFDEMAKEYYVKDRDFYNKNFAPFYSNPLISATRGKKPVRLVFSLSLFIFIMGLTAAMIMFFSEDQSGSKPTIQKDQRVIPVEKSEKPATSIKDSTGNEKVQEPKSQEDIKQSETRVKENTGKREVRNKPIERQR